MIDKSTLNKGDWIVVRFGADRKQNAVYHGTDSKDRVVVRKWRAQSQTFTGPVKVAQTDILEKLDGPQHRKRGAHR